MREFSKLAGYKINIMTNNFQIHQQNPLEAIMEEKPFQYYNNKNN